MHKPQVGQTVAKYRENALASPIDFLDGWMTEISTKRPTGNFDASSKKIVNRFAAVVHQQLRGNKASRRKQGWEAVRAQRQLQGAVLKGHVVLSFDVGKQDMFTLTVNAPGVDMSYTEQYNAYDTERYRALSQMYPAIHDLKDPS